MTASHQSAPLTRPHHSCGVYLSKYHHLSHHSSSTWSEEAEARAAWAPRARGEGSGWHHSHHHRHHRPINKKNDPTVRRVTVVSMMSMSLMVVASSAVCPQYRRSGQDLFPAATSATVLCMQSAASQGNHGVLPTKRVPTTSSIRSRSPYCAHLCATLV